jgi:SAM-dependent methyltransferase
MDNFYYQTIKALTQQKRIQPDHQVLVVCGTQLDRDVLSAAGCVYGVISNVDESVSANALSPFAFAHQNVEALTYANGSFDWVLVHHGLHHCREPHRALTEIYRVARHGIIVFEPCRNALVAIGRHLKVGQECEVHAVAANALTSGGVNNEAIPNYVYRFTAEELISTLRAYAPEFDLKAEVTYHMEIHWHDLREKRDRRPLWLARLAYPFLRLLIWIRPSMSNTMCVVIPKSDTLHPWLQRDKAGQVIPKDAWFQQFGRSA